MKLLARGVGFGLIAGVGWMSGGAVDEAPVFELVQPDLFSAPGGQPNCWADFDNDGDLDQFVGFASAPNRLYRNDGGRFTDVAAAVGLADPEITRAAAWGDFDVDGQVDLYVGFQDGKTSNRLYRNQGNGRFTNVAPGLGLELIGTSRQPSWVDYDNDGDLDLFTAFRDRPNRLFRNDGGKFTDVTEASGIGDPRKTVGAVWWDFDKDGDLDVFVANQEGDSNGFFRNDGGRFVDVARELGVDASGRPKEEGGVGPSLADYDGDGDLDLFVANYGPNALYRNEGGRTFVREDVTLGGPPGSHATTSNWGDFDNDGRPDLYVGATVNGVPHYPDFLYRNEGPAGDGRVRFANVLPEIVRTHDATHGVQWVDFDRDGALDLALTGNGRDDGHYLFRNRFPADRAGRSLAVEVVDAQGRRTRAGAEVRVYATGTPTLLGTRLVDTGSGYCSQNAAPVHFGLPAGGPVDVEVTFLTREGRKKTRVSRVDPGAYLGRALSVQAP